MYCMARKRFLFNFSCKSILIRIFFLMLIFKSEKNDANVQKTVQLKQFLKHVLLKLFTIYFLMLVYKSLNLRPTQE
jgi:hypothetical protein